MTTTEQPITSEVPPRIWRAGDRCRVRCPDGSDRHGIVLLASDNGRSLFVELDGGTIRLLITDIEIVVAPLESE